jgi:predicted MFS family arabinose efflux permease
MMPVPNDVVPLVAARGLRGFADGVVSVLLAGHLQRLGFSAFQIGAIVTGTLFGSAALTVAVAILGHRLHRRTVLFGACALMLATGVGFAALGAFGPLLIIAVAGTLNPSSGDVSVFLPVEQAALAEVVPSRELTRTFAWYNLSGTILGAIGALASGLPAATAARFGVAIDTADRAAFLGYAAVAVAIGALYQQLSPRVESREVRAQPLTTSRRIVLRLAALFSLDSFGGGFAVQSLLVLWLNRRFGLSVQTTGAIFFVAGLLAAFSQFLAARLAVRIGRVRTMVYTHLPANLFLVLAGVMPTAELAVFCLLVRMALSQMDVPARQSYVMAMVPADERAAAASVTNVPRSFATALPPLLAGMMLERSAVGWPLVCGGIAKAIYDLLLLAQFRGLAPPDEIHLRATDRS